MTNNEENKGATLAPKTKEGLGQIKYRENTENASIKVALLADREGIERGYQERYKVANLQREEENIIE